MDGAFRWTRRGFCDDQRDLWCLWFRARCPVLLPSFVHELHFIIIESIYVFLKLLMFDLLFTGLWGSGWFTGSSITIFLLFILIALTVFLNWIGILYSWLHIINFCFGLKGSIRTIQKLWDCTWSADRNESITVYSFLDLIILRCPAS